MRRGILVSALASGAAAIAAGFGFGADAAEFGAGPWIKGGTDIFAGVVPSQPGFYSRTDVYHYAADVSAVVFNGRVEVGVDQEMTATLPAVTYVTPWKLFGGTYAVGIVPSIMVADADVGIGLPPITGPLGNSFGPITLERGDTNLALGDTGLSGDVRLGCRKFSLERGAIPAGADRRLQHKATGQHEPEPLGAHAAPCRHLFRPEVGMASERCRRLCGKLRK